jgi:hypothetical protein
MNTIVSIGVDHHLDGWRVVSVDADLPTGAPRAEQDADVMGMEYAMVQVIDNRADVEGRVLAVRPDTARPHYHVVTVDVGAAAPVEGYPNLFADATGKPLEISLPSDRVKSLVVGAAVRCRVRRAGPTTVIGDHCTPR